MSDALSSEQLQQIEAVVRRAVREEISDAGLRLDDAAHQDEAREDFRFLRRMRKAIDGIASKVGVAVIMAILGGVFWLFTAGLNFWKGQ